MVPAFDDPKEVVADIIDDYLRRRGVNGKRSSSCQIRYTNESAQRVEAQCPSVAILHVSKLWHWQPRKA